MNQYNEIKYETLVIVNYNNVKTKRNEKKNCLNGPYSGVLFK